MKIEQAQRMQVTLKDRLLVGVQIICEYLLPRQSGALSKAKSEVA